MNEAMKSGVTRSELSNGVLEESAAAEPSLKFSGRESPSGEESTVSLARVRGVTLREFPRDLYVPPEALRVFLDSFEGPLDLLLYLIRKHDFDVLEISVSAVTDQYLQYIQLMDQLDVNLAGEYLAMAALLTAIKSRMLLPIQPSVEEDEEDPRAAIVRRLKEFEHIKRAAKQLDEMPRMHREFFPASAESKLPPEQRPLPDVELDQLMSAFSDVLLRASYREHHEMTAEVLSVSERMADILAQVASSKTFVPFIALFCLEEGRRGVVVTFLAITQLIQKGSVNIVQNGSFAPIYIAPAETAKAA